MAFLRVCSAVAASIATQPLIAQSPSILIRPAVAAQLTWTNNVDLRPNADRRSDFVMEVTPSLLFEVKRPRLELTGTVSAPIILYARESGESYVQAQANLRGRVEAIERFFFVEAEAIVAPQYFSPFGARPEGSINITENRYTAASYRVSPYIEGFLSNNIRYTLRDENLWTQATSSPAGVRDIYSNLLTGSIERDPTPLGWRAELERSEYDFNQIGGTSRMELVRIQALYQSGPDLRVFLSGGYERNRFPLTESDGAIYGLGVTWRPSQRTRVDASWEHRFFGPAYHVEFDHRTPLSSWSVRASRDVSSYPQEVATLGVGGSVSNLLNTLFLSRIPDAAERTRVVEAYINERGLPPTLAEPLALFAQRLTLLESVSASVGLIGARNAVVMSLFRTRNEDLSGTGGDLPLTVDPFANTLQIGANASWSYQLTPSSTLNLTGTLSETEPTDERAGKTENRAARLTLTHRISPKTSAFAGARYQRQSSNFEAAFDEFAVFIGLNHLFR